MENDKNANVGNSKLSFEQFNRNTKKELYELYLIHKDDINYKGNLIQECNFKIKELVNTNKCYKYVIYCLLVIIFIMVIYFIIFNIA